MRSRNGLKRLVSPGLRNKVKDLFGVAALQDQINELDRRFSSRLDQIETTLYESKEDTWERSRVRWRNTQPAADLTWGKELKGHNFIAKLQSHGAFGPDKALLEVGPGYGRLLRAMFELNVPFGSYLGVDISPTNVSHLRQTFPHPRVNFINADVETAAFDQTFDVVFSSLTFKHLFPSFEKALRNLARFLESGGTCFIDLIEGRQRYFEDDGVTYIRHYEREEIRDIVERAELTLAGFDEVRHDPERVRLLLIARK